MSIGVPAAIVESLRDNHQLALTAFEPVHGGCINNGGKITTSDGVFFIKWNSADKFPGMFAAEARGLTLLRSSCDLAVPSAVITGLAGSYQFLVLEYVNEARRSANYWRTFGMGLAKLHSVSAEHFGLDHDNYIGSLPQSNNIHDSWITFFIEERLKAQLELAVREKRIDPATRKIFGNLFEKLHDLIPDENPALLHGDLWSGNLITSANGLPCLIDPAVYFGHREVDLAMTQLFGGFDSSFFQSYNEVYPVSPGFRERLGLYNLYPLLVHVNLFGGGYLNQALSIVKRFV